jgi:hypothetical protein
MISYATDLAIRRHEYEKIHDMLLKAGAEFPYSVLQVEWVSSEMASFLWQPSLWIGRLRLIVAETELEESVQQG